jgi:hypothetical protein
LLCAYTGPLTKKRIETVGDETSDRALAFIEEQHKVGKPFFVWWSGTRMHFRTHVKPQLRGISGQDEYSDGMVEHDRHVGKFLKKRDDLGIAQHMDRLPAFLAAAGEPDIKEKLLREASPRSDAATRCTWRATTCCRC